MPMTMREKFLVALKARGATEVDNRHSKFVKLTRPSGEKFYFVGKSGSLRIGANVRTSVPASDDFKKRLLEEAVNVAT